MATGVGGCSIEKQARYRISAGQGSRGRRVEAGPTGELAESPDSECDRTAGTGAGTMYAQKPADVWEQRCSLRPVHFETVQVTRAGDGLQVYTAQGSDKRRTNVAYSLERCAVMRTGSCMGIPHCVCRIPLLQQ